MKTSKTRPTIYFVEGECEQKLISELKKEPALMVPGKARVFNVLTKRISSSQLMVIKPGTNVCMVFDTDGEQNLTILNENIKKLKTYVSNVHIYLLIQVQNLEDELVRSTDLKRIEDLTNSQSRKDFKRAFLSMNNCRDVLEQHGFDITQMWCTKALGVFSKLESKGIEDIIIA